MRNFLFKGSFQKGRNRVILLLVTLIIAGLLSACEEDGRPTREPQLSLVAPTFAPLIDTLPPATPARNLPPGATPAPPPTPADIVGGTPIPKFQIFVTPPPLATFEAARNYGERGRISEANTKLKPENLQLLNGVPFIPYIPPPQSKQPPLPALQVNYGVGGRPRVGLQIGHLDTPNLPDEWASMRGQTGGSGGGYTELQINIDIARRTAALLISRGITVDLISAIVPPGYTADAFVAIHCDAVTNPNPTGFKIARHEASAIPKTDDSLVANLYSQYAASTFMARDGSITDNMTGYYAFNGPYRYYAIGKITPAAIIELGFLTNPSDRSVLVNRADDVARGIANGVITFLNQRPPLEQREKAIGLSPAIESKLDNTPIYDSPNGNNLIAYVSRQQVFTSYTDNGSSYGVWLPILDKPGYVRKSDAAIVSVPR